MEKEIDELIDIIKNEFGADIRKKTRRQAYVDGRFAFVKILTDRGYGLSDLGKAIGKHHSTIIHHRNTANDLLQTNEVFATKYKICKDKFLYGKDTIIEISSSEQLHSQVESLILEKNELLNKLEKHKRLHNLIELLERRIPRGKEAIMLVKINHFLNGTDNN